MGDALDIVLSTTKLPPSTRPGPLIMKAKKPRYDLLAAQKETNIEIPTHCVTRANELLRGSDIEARRYIDRLFRSLLPADFARTQEMAGVKGVRLYGDVYGKVDEYLDLWFIKFSFEERTVIMSCHPAERDLELADGRTLKKNP